MGRSIESRQFQALYMRNRILIIDDDELLLDCLARTLKAYFDLDVALGPAAALEALTNRGPYAVLVSDIRMPGLSGVQLLAKAKTICPDTVGILMSGDPDDYSNKETLDRNLVFRLLDKLGTRETLVQSLQEALAYHESKTTK
jgi:DNA-binding NtrC family response regulator